MQDYINNVNLSCKNTNFAPKINTYGSGAISLGQNRDTFKKEYIKYQQEKTKRLDKRKIFLIGAAITVVALAILAILKRKQLGSALSDLFSKESKSTVNASNSTIVNNAKATSIQVQAKTLEESTDDFIRRIITRSSDKQVDTLSMNKYLTKEEQEPFKSYLANGSLGRYKKNKIDNNSLRHGCPITNSIKLMDECFTKAPPLEKEAVVYRAISCDRLPDKTNLLECEAYDFIQSFKAQHTIEDKAFISTGVYADARCGEFMDFARATIRPERNGILMRIHLPKGTKGILITCTGEDEYLLPRKSSLYINSLNVIDGVKVADCTYIIP